MLQTVLFFFNSKFVVQDCYVVWIELLWTIAVDLKTSVFLVTYSNFMKY